MAPSRLAVDLLAAFNQACHKYSSPDEEAPLSTFIRMVDSLLFPCSDAACAATTAETMGILEQLFQSDAPHAVNVLEIVLSQLLETSSDCADMIDSCQTAFRRLVGRLAITASPRDSVTIFLGQIAGSGPPMPVSSSILISELPKALARLSRQQVQTLADVLEAVGPVLAGSFAASYSMLPAEPLIGSLSEVLATTAQFYSGLVDALRTWPDNLQANAQQLAAASLLRWVSEVGVLSFPLAVELPQLPQAAATHFCQRDSAGAKQRAAAAAVDILKYFEHFQVHDLLQMSALPEPVSSTASMEETETSKAVVSFCALCCPACSHILREPCPGDLLMQLAAQQVPLLLHAAGELQSLAAAQKGLALAVAAVHASRSGDSEQSGIPEFEGHTERLLDCLMVTMTQNPEQVLRNAATHAFNSLLAALQGRARLKAVEHVHDWGHPGVSAQAIQGLTRFTAETWPGGPSQQQQDDWEALQPGLLPAVLDWILPSGRHWAREAASLIKQADAVSAALNLYRLLLLKERSSRSNLTGVLDPGCLDEVRRSGLLPLQALASRALQQLQTQAVAADAVPDLSLALQRVLEVLSRVLEVVDDIH